MDRKDLIDIARNVNNYAYAPYSGFKVGAAVLTEDGNIFTGVNVENVSFGATNCAERTAIFSAVTGGQKQIKAIAIASDSNDIIFPWGICRQVMAEFGNEDMEVICSKPNGDYEAYTLGDLLANAFTKDKIKNKK